MGCVSSGRLAVTVSVELGLLVARTLTERLVVGLAASEVAAAGWSTARGVSPLAC